MKKKTTKAYQIIEDWLYEDENGFHHDYNVIGLCDRYDHAKRIVRNMFSSVWKARIMSKAMENTRQEWSPMVVNPTEPLCVPTVQFDFGLPNGHRVSIVDWGKAETC